MSTSGNALHNGNVFPERELPESTSAIARWKKKAADQLKITGLAVGSLREASLVNRDGIDFVVVNNTGKFRSAGFGLVASLMPYDDANAAVLDMAAGVIPEIRHATVLAGLCGVDPFRMPRTLLSNAVRAGYAGIQNFPSVGFFDGRFRKQLERSGLGFGLEVEMVRLASDMNILCVPLVFNRAEAIDMMRAGAEALLFHRGLAIPGERYNPEENAKAFGEAFAPVLDVRPDILLLNQSAGSTNDDAFLSELKGGVPCHGFFVDGELEQTEM